MTQRRKNREKERKRKKRDGKATGTNEKLKFAANIERVIRSLRNTWTIITSQRGAQAY